MAASDVKSLTKQLGLLECNRASKFMAMAPDDVLMEILARLPDARVATHFATVCKRWCSIIMNPYFRLRFAQIHAHQKYSDLCFLFKCSTKPKIPFFTLPLNECEYEPEPFCLSFLPDPAPLEIKAACRDLLLVGRTGETIFKSHEKAVLQYYICDSRTRHWFALPEIPQVHDFQDWIPIFSAEGSSGCALVCDPHNNLRFKVFVIYLSRFWRSTFSFHAAVYDSDTDQWSFSFNSIPHEAPDCAVFRTVVLEIVVADNGTLYWLDGLLKLHGVAAFDPFTSQFHLIQFPSGECTDISPHTAKDKVRVGVVRGRLRLLRLQNIDNGSFGLRIWELDHDNIAWNLAHDIALDTWGLTADTMLFFVLAFDPGNGNAIFLVRDKDIYRYDIDRDFHERVGKFPISCCVDGGDSFEKMKESVSNYLTVSTLVQPFWPTQIPFK